MAHKTILDIGKGEPDFPTPAHVKQAAHEAINADFTKYTPQPGIPELRRAVARKFATENGIVVDPEQVVISCGGKHSVEQAIRCLVRPDDEVLIVTPHWFAYPEQVTFAGGRPVLVPADESDDFLPDPRTVRKAISAKTHLLILNSPNNPTGAVYPRGLLEELAQIAMEHNLFVLSDEVYEKVLFEGAKHVSIASLGADIAARTITVNSVSKTHAMTGWRIGYAALPGDLARRVIALQRVSTSAPSSVSQRAALAALTAGQQHVKAMAAAYTERRRRTLERLAGIPSFSTVPPRGTFYCFVNIDGMLDRSICGARIDGADAFVRVLRELAGVQIISGAEFGSDRHIRISFAAALNVLDEAFDRIEEMLR